MRVRNVQPLRFAGPGRSSFTAPSTPYCQRDHLEVIRHVASVALLSLCLHSAVDVDADKLAEASASCLGRRGAEAKL